MVTNLMLSLGGPFANILYLIVFQAAGGLNSNLSTVWVSVFALSIIPPLSVFYFRLKMINSKLYRKSAIQKNVPYLLTITYYWRSLLGCSISWFLYDFVVFPNGIFSGVIISSIISSTGHEKIRQTAQYQLLLGAISLPGLVFASHLFRNGKLMDFSSIFVGAYLLRYLSRRNIMVIGFSAYVVFGLIVGLLYDKIITRIGLFIFLYGMMTSFGNLGPGNQLG